MEIPNVIIANISFIHPATDLIVVTFKITNMYIANIITITIIKSQ